MISRKIEQYVGRQVDFLKEVTLQDDGEGAYVKKWNIAEVAEPTAAQLDAIDTATLEHNIEAIENRKKAYGSIVEQVEYITENGIEAWQSKVEGIKNLYPKI